MLNSKNTHLLYNLFLTALIHYILHSKKENVIYSMFFLDQIKCSWESITVMHSCSFVIWLNFFCCVPLSIMFLQNSKVYCTCWHRDFKVATWAQGKPKIRHYCLMCRSLWGTVLNNRSDQTTKCSLTVFPSRQ